MQRVEQETAGLKGGSPMVGLLSLLLLNVSQETKKEKKNGLRDPVRGLKKWTLLKIYLVSPSLFFFFPSHFLFIFLSSCRGSMGQLPLTTLALVKKQNACNFILN